MKTIQTTAGRASGQRGMTLVEMMTSMGLFTLTLAALLSVNYFGERQDEYVNSQLGASEEARKNFNLMLDEIRSGKNVQIGSGADTNFTPIGNGLQQGDTIQIIESTNTGWTNYYFFTSNRPSGENASNFYWLMRVAVSPSGTVGSNVVARNLFDVTNQWVTSAMNFSALGFNGSAWVPLTNDPTTYSTHNYIVNVLLQFYEYQYPLTRVGSNYLFDYYGLNLQAARRAP
jgi:type II secretory pathway pseudopilin PulG